LPRLAGARSHCVNRVRYGQMHQALRKVNPADGMGRTAQGCVHRTERILAVTSASRRRSRYMSLLQIAGALSIVGNHVGLPHSNLAWIFLDVFFVMAGMNMARILESDRSIGSYGLSRIKRLGPHILAIWCIAVAFLLSGLGSPGMSWFIATGPAFVQNLVQPFFAYTPIDRLFGPLWFVAALMQLQLLLFSMGKVIARTRPEIVLVAAVGIALLFRTLYPMLTAQSPASLATRDAGILYVQPLTHLEAIVLGVLIGRGALPRIGRLLPIFCLLAISLVAINLAYSPAEMSDAIGIAAGLGFEYPLRLQYAHIWGYTVIAFAAASLASRNGPLADGIEKLRLPARVDNILFALASLTYGIRPPRPGHGYRCERGVAPGSAPRTGPAATAFHDHGGRGIPARLAVSRGDRWNQKATHESRENTEPVGRGMCRRQPAPTLDTLSTVCLISEEQIAFGRQATRRGAPPTMLPAVAGACDGGRRR
jgi:acyltransferase-like protein